MEVSPLKKRLQKLVKTCDSLTMKIFISIECLGEEMSTANYNIQKKSLWEEFLERREACRLDFDGHDKLRKKYECFQAVPLEDRSTEICTAVYRTLLSKGAVDCFKQIDPSQGSQNTLSKTFPEQVVKMFEKKLDSWFSSFDAVAVKLTGHVKVSNFVRVVSGQVDILATRDDFTYILDIQTTMADTPRFADIAHLCILKMLSIQNGLEDPNNVRLGLLTFHFHSDRPVLRLWEYDPTVSMERAIREGDIDKLIEAGKQDEHHELWKGNATILDNRNIDTLLNTS